MKIKNIFYNTKIKFNNDFSLVLSGGSALGFAHVGVIKYLEEIKTTPKEIIGTSMGALIGAAYAMGKNYNDIIEIISKLNYLKLFKVNFLPINSLIKINKIKSLLEEIFLNITFEDLNIPLKIIATNIETGEATVFDKNSKVPLIDAICASFSVPALFEKYEINGKYYWDGFLSSNLPVEYSSYKKILAINVVKKDIIKKVHHIKLNQAIEKTILILLLNQTIDKIKHYPDIYFVDMDLSMYNMFEFYKWQEIINTGYIFFSKYINTINNKKIS